MFCSLAPCFPLLVRRRVAKNDGLTCARSGKRGDRGLEAALSDLSTIENKCDSHGRIENIRRSAIVTLQALNTVANAPRSGINTVVALKGRNATAQGAALGRLDGNLIEALKGRHVRDVLFRSFSANVLDAYVYPGLRPGLSHCAPSELFVPVIRKLLDSLRAAGPTSAPCKCRATSHLPEV